MSCVSLWQWRWLGAPRGATSYNIVTRHTGKTQTLIRFGPTNKQNTYIKYRNNEWRQWLGLETQQAPSVLSQIFWLLVHAPSIVSKQFCWVRCFDSKSMLLALSANNPSQEHSFGTCWQWPLTQPRHSSSDSRFANSDCWHGAFQAESVADQHLHHIWDKWTGSCELGRDTVHTDKPPPLTFGHLNPSHLTWRFKYMSTWGRNLMS